jgi:hypothetical protein
MASLLKTIATTPEVLALLLFLLVPGFVFVRAFDELHPGRRRGSGQMIIDSGLWSCAILAVWFMPALILFQLGPRLPYWLYHLLLFVFIVLGVFFTPLLLAYIFHRLELRGTLKNLGTKQSPTPSDLLFSNSEGKHYYVRFHRKDGKDLGGYFGENSVAASSANGQEIYVEEVWRLDEDGRFIERIEGTAGAIVNREDCELIEFFEAPEAHDESTLEGGRTEPDTTANARKRLGD